jgi:predicted metal-dependent phosphoesterase TrpH
VTEHGLLWGDDDLAKAAGEWGIRLYPGLEVETDIGHVLVIGGTGYAPGMHRLSVLAEHAARDGAALVLAHPFRHHVNPSPGQQCILTRRAAVDTRTPAAAVGRGSEQALPALSLIHALETVNGATGEDDNAFAAQVAALAGLPATGGSDAHSRHGIGAGVTVVPGDPRNAGELAELLRDGMSRAAYGPPAAGALRHSATASKGIPR